MNKKPRIAIPLGDPAGVGPEIVVKSIASQEVFDAAECVVIGDKKIIDKAIEITGVDITVHVIAEPEYGDFRPGVLNLIDLDNVDMAQFAYGKVNGMCGQAAFAYIEKSIALANAGRVDAVATTPINKESLRSGNINFIGHTEIFGALTNTEDPLTMFETNGMRVFFLTRHVSLRDMLDMIKKDRIKDYVKRCLEALRKLGVQDGTMAIAGLNPSQRRTWSVRLGRSERNHPCRRRIAGRRLPCCRPHWRGLCIPSGCHRQIQQRIIPLPRPGTYCHQNSGL